MASGIGVETHLLKTREETCILGLPTVHSSVSHSGQPLPLLITFRFLLSPDASIPSCGTLFEFLSCSSFS